MTPQPPFSVPDLIAEVERLLVDAEKHKAELGAVNWGNLGVADVEWRLSLTDMEARPYVVVMIEEASPDCGLGGWLSRHLDRERFPRTFIECEW